MDGSNKNKIKVNIEFGGQGGSSGCLGRGVFKMLFRETNTFFCGRGLPKSYSFEVWKPRTPIGMKSLWSVRCATLSASVSFVQAFCFAGDSASSVSALVSGSMMQMDEVTRGRTVG